MIFFSVTAVISHFFPQPVVCSHKNISHLTQIRSDCRLDLERAREKKAENYTLTIIEAQMWAKSSCCRLRCALRKKTLPLRVEWRSSHLTDTENGTTERIVVHLKQLEITLSSGIHYFTMIRRAMTIMKWTLSMECESLKLQRDISSLLSTSLMADMLHIKNSSEKLTTVVHRNMSAI